jgi:hypothetical protein
VKWRTLSPIRRPQQIRPRRPGSLTSLDPADRGIAKKIRDLLATKLDRSFLSKKEGAAASLANITVYAAARSGK